MDGMPHVIPILAILFCATITLSVRAQSASKTAPQKAPQKAPPNVLFIAVDDLRPELGCYGQAHAESPCLDQFAKGAVLFTNHFVQVPTCGASRFAMLTGRSPLHSRALGNAALYQGPTRLLPKPQLHPQTFPELFRRNGYRTVCIGKISHTPDGKVFAYDGSGDGRDELPGAWDELATPYGPWRRGWGSFFAYHGGRHREDGQGNRDLMEFVAESDDQLPDGLMASTAIDRLKRLQKRQSETGQPFLMGLGFFKPHLPWVATRADWDAFQDGNIPAPGHPQKLESLGWHRSGEFYGYRMDFDKTRPLAAVDQLTAKRAYLACVRYVDRQIGRVLESLDELGLADNTMVVIWGDHGWHLGESAIWGKHSPFDRSLRSVLMIRAPQVSLAGYQCHELVESVDLYPTLLDLCNPNERQTAYPLDGYSLLPLLQGGRQPLRQVAMSFFQGGFTARSKTHRYIAQDSPKPSEQDRHEADLLQEFYNLTESPEPVTNVFGNETAKLRRLIEQLLRKE